MNGPDQLLPALYGLYENPTTYAADFHDITVGNSGLYMPALVTIWSRELDRQLSTS